MVIMLPHKLKQDLTILQHTLLNNAGIEAGIHVAVDGSKITRILTLNLLTNIFSC